MHTRSKLPRLQIYTNYVLFSLYKVELHVYLKKNRILLFFKCPININEYAFNICQSNIHVLWSVLALKNFLHELLTWTLPSKHFICDPYGQLIWNPRRKCNQVGAGTHMGSPDTFIWVQYGSYLGFPW